MRKKWCLDENEFNEIKKIYNDLYVDNKEELTKYKNTFLKRLIIIIAILTIVIVGSIIGGNAIEVEPTIIGLIIFISIPIALWKYISAEHDLKRKYKNILISKFIKSVNHRYTYGIGYMREQKESEMIKFQYKNIGFDNKSFTRFSIEDFIEGKTENGISVKTMDVDIYYNAEKHESRISKQVFLGNLTIIDIANNCDIKILKNKINIFDRKNLVEINEDEFSKYFDVYSKNKEDVDKYLTPNLLSYIKEFRVKYNIDFEIIFKDKVYVRFYTKDMFEPKIFNKKAEEKFLYKYYIIMKFIEDFAKIYNF